MAETVVIDESSSEWEVLHAIWLADGMPGWVTTANGMIYRVLRPGDDKVKFAVQGKGEMMYGTTSAKGLTKNGQ